MPGLNVEVPKGKTELKPRWRLSAGDYAGALNVAPARRCPRRGHCAAQACFRQLRSRGQRKVMVVRRLSDARASWTRPGLKTLAWDSESKLLATGGQDTSVLLWEPRKQKKPLRFTFLEEQVTALEWHPEHHTLLGADP